MNHASIDHEAAAYNANDQKFNAGEITKEAHQDKCAEIEEEFPRADAEYARSAEQNEMFRAANLP